MANLTKILSIGIISTMISTSLFALETKDIDEGFASIKILNNEANILNFPFKVKKANVVSQTPENFTTKAEGSSIIVMPTTELKSEKADLIVTSKDDYTFVINISTGGSERIFNFNTNKVEKSTPEQMQFESGKVDTDMKLLLKKAIADEPIAGYKKLEVKRQFDTPDLQMQKEYILDGGKYRVEKWFLKNKSLTETVVLDEASFYTNGILAIAFEVPKIPADKVASMWLVINKTSLENK